MKKPNVSKQLILYVSDAKYIGFNLRKLLAKQSNKI